MSQKLFATTIILTVLGLVVAVVSAQERAPHRSSSSADPQDEQPLRERSVLTRPSRSGSQAVGSGLATPKRTRSQAGLSDRLQRLHSTGAGQSDSDTEEPAARTAVRAPVGGPVTLNPSVASPGSSQEVAADDGVRQESAQEARADGAMSNAPSDLDSREARSIPAEDASPAGSSGQSTERRSGPASKSRSQGDRALASDSGPAVQVRTRGPEAVVIGEPSEFTISLENLGQQTAPEVDVRIVLPDWVELQEADASNGATQRQDRGGGEQGLIWNVRRVATGAEEELKLRLVASDSRPFELSVDWTLRGASSVAQIDVHEPQLELTVFGPEEILYGESSIYTIQLTNPGTGPAKDVTLSFSYGGQRLPPKEIGSLDAGEQTEVSVELTARQAGTLQVAAEATAAAGLRADAAEEVLVRRPQLKVDVVGSRVKFAGSVTTYEIHAHNTGDAPAEEVVLSVLLPSGAEYVGGDMTLTESGALVKRIGEVPADAQRTIKVQCKLTVPGDTSIEARARGSADLSSSGEFTTSVKALADLKLRVNDPSGPVAVGSDTVYELTITNRGTKAATQVKVVAQFSEGIEPVEAKGGGAEIVPGQVLFQPIERIGAGEKVTLKVTARADREGNHRFRSEVRCTQPETILVAEESTYFFGDPPSTARSSGSGETR